MRADENKALIEAFMEKMGTSQNLDEILSFWADDSVWIIPGTTKWSGTYRGKKEIVEKLLTPITAQMASPGSVTIDNVIADDDCVVVQARAHDRVTTTGKPYNNTYCLVYRIVDSKIQELTEYCDTELVTSAFGMAQASPQPK